MSLPRTVAGVLRGHVTLQGECIDRMYLNAYVPRLQYESGVARFFRHHRGHPLASSALMDPISKAFVAAIHAFVHEQGVPLITFAKGQRKDDVMAEHLKGFTAPEGVVFRGAGPGKDPGAADGEAPEPGDRTDLSLAGSLDGHGQPLLHLRDLRGG
jgi:hypothetical protein